MAVGDVFEELKHKGPLGLLLFLLLYRGQTGGEVALTVAMKLGAIFVNTKIINDKFLAQLVIEVQERHHPCFDAQEY